MKHEERENGENYWLDQRHVQLTNDESKQQLNDELLDHTTSAQDEALLDDIDDALEDDTLLDDIGDVLEDDTLLDGIDDVLEQNAAEHVLSDDDESLEPTSTFERFDYSRDDAFNDESFDDEALGQYNQTEGYSRVNHFNYASQDDFGGQDEEYRPWKRVSTVPRKSHKKLWIILGSVLGALLIANIAVAFYFSTHFGFQTIINGVDCSFMEVSQVEAIIEEQTKSYVVSIVERENATEKIKGSQIDLKYLQDNELQALLERQISFFWLMRLFSNDCEHKIIPTVSYDEGKLKAAVDALNCMETEKMIAPVDAYPEFDGTQYVAHPEVLGTTIDTLSIYDVIGTAIYRYDSSVDLDANGCYVPPAIITTSAALLETLALYNEFIPFNLVYTFGDTLEELNASTMVKWVTFNDDGTSTLNEDAIWSWVADFASRHDTVGTTRTFKSIDGNTYNVSGGTYGWEIDQDAEVKSIIQMFSDKQSQQRDPYYTSTAAGYAPDMDWGKEYIEVNLSTQHIYYVDNGEIKFESDVVTGLPTPKKITPDGVWSILDKRSPYTMTGEIQAATGEPEYRTNCSYWMRVTWSGVGFHDATWQPWFGGNRYTYAGSHGCINMPYYGAQTLYSIVWVGLPVVIYYAE